MKLPDVGWQPGYARDLAFTRDSRRLCTWEADFRLHVWDVHSGRLLAEHRPRPDGFPAETVDDDGPRRRHDEKLVNASQWFCFSADGAELFWYFNKLRSYDALTGHVKRTIDDEVIDSGGYYHGQMSQDGELLLIGGMQSGATILNARLGKKRGHIAVGHGVYCSGHALAADSRSFAIVTSFQGQHEIRIFETATLQPRVIIALQQDSASQLNFSPDSRFLAVTLANHTALIWDLRPADH
jgi:WD40 repeat protein